MFEIIPTEIIFFLLKTEFMLFQLIPQLELQAC
jgi:hypothetical protein